MLQKCRLCAEYISAISTASRICALSFPCNLAELQASNRKGNQATCISCTPWTPTANESIPSRRRALLLELQKTKPADHLFFTRSKLAMSPNQRIRLDSVPMTNTQGIESLLRKGDSDRGLQVDIADQLVIRYGLLLTQLSE